MIEAWRLRRFYAASMFHRASASISRFCSSSFWRILSLVPISDHHNLEREELLMSTSVKELVRRYREELWNEGNLKVADEIIARDCRYHIYDPITTLLGTGPERAMKAVLQFRSAFPDLHITIEDLFAEGDRAMVRWTFRGTHTGVLFGVAPSRMIITIAGMDMYRVVDGKIQEYWVNWDTMGFMQQLGLEPVAAGVSA
jgi:steroid delta-isomerase-like uncharacterized protein